MKYIIIPIITIITFIAVKPVLAYISSKWLDTTQIAHISTPTGSLSIYTLKDTAATCYITASEGAPTSLFAPAISCVASPK